MTPDTPSGNLVENRAAVGEVSGHSIADPGDHESVIANCRGALIEDDLITIGHCTIRATPGGGYPNSVDQIVVIVIDPRYKPRVGRRRRPLVPKHAQISQIFCDT